MTPTKTVALSGQLINASAAMRAAAGYAEHIADWLDRTERVDADIVFEHLEDISMLTVRLLAAATKAQTRLTDDVRTLDRRDRITYELLHTAASAARQFNAALADIADEHRTLP